MSAPQPQPGRAPHGPARTARRRRRPAALVLTVLLVAALGLGGYLWLTTVRWQADSATWQAEAHGYADQVAALRAELEATDAELVSAREQLATATDRISDLANEKAQLGDENVASQQYLDRQTQVSEAAGAVATAMDQCVEAQSQLIGYLEDSEAYDQKDLDRFSSDVQTLCKQAGAAHEQLQRELQQDENP